MGLTKAFLLYAFGLGRPGHDIGEVVDEVSEGEPTPETISSERQTRHLIILAINWTMLLILVVGFLDVIVASWIRPDARVPDLVQDVVSGAAGYFLSALVSFVRHN